MELVTKRSECTVLCRMRENSPSSIITLFKWQLASLCALIKFGCIDAELVLFGHNDNLQLNLYEFFSKELTTKTMKMSGYVFFILLLKTNFKDR